MIDVLVRIIPVLAFSPIPVGRGMGWRPNLFMILFSLLLFRFRVFAPLKCEAAASMQTGVEKNNKNKA
jgi:hypothetical protein